jgi:hypothetical protein
MGEDEGGGEDKIIPPHPNPLPCLRRSGFAQAGARGEGRPFIPTAELGRVFWHIFIKVMTLDQTKKIRALTMVWNEEKESCAGFNSLS